jgi:hypothetical protein
MYRLFAVALTALSCAGCLRSTTTINLKLDGSGTIDQEIGATPQAIAMFKSMAANQAKGQPMPEIFGREQAEKLASSMGGVTFLSGEPIKTAELEGYRAKYGFDDITKVRANLTQGSNLAGAGAASSAEPPVGFGFERTGSSSLLTVRMPDEKTNPFKSLARTAGGGSSDDPASNAQALAMMKTMMRGLFVDVALAVDGRVIKTNAPYVDGQRITLAQIDFDKLLDTPGALEKLQQTSDPKMLAGIPGVKVATGPTLTIEFGR